MHLRFSKIKKSSNVKKINAIKFHQIIHLKTINLPKKLLENHISFHHYNGSSFFLL